MSFNAALVAVLALVVLGCAVSPGVAKGSNWKIGEPIVTYWAGPATFMELDDRAAEQIVAGGWNLGWARNVEDLDTYYRHGIRALMMVNIPDINDPVQAKALEEKIKLVRNHPAMYAYFIGDEPNASAFPALGKLIAFIKKLDPTHLSYINLLPVDAPVSMLGTQGDTATAYKEHVEQFVKLVKPELLSYDFYNFLEGGDNDNYFLNLSIIRDAAIKAKIPFMNIVQAIGWPGYRPTDEHQLRWLAYTTLAYGGLGISHFRYDMGFWKDAATPTPLYWPVSRINRDFLTIAKQLQSLESIGAYHCGVVPKGGLPLPERAIFTLENPSQNVLLGYFGKNANQPTYVLVVNLDYKNAVDTVLVGQGEMEVFNSSTGLWQAFAGQHIKLDLLPGEGALVRVR